MTKLAFDAEPARRRYRLRLARYKAMAEAIAAYLRERDNHTTDRLRLLDAGPGSGRSLRFMEAEGHADRLDLHGIDNSERRLRTIYQPARWQLICGDLTKGLPYPSEHFDVCLCEQVLEHLERPDKVVAELVRVLRSGGLMIVGVPTFPPPIDRLRAAYCTLMTSLGVEQSHVQSFSSRSFSRLVCKDRPLQVIAMRGFRVVSGGVLSPLEDHAWWYRWNRWIGKTAPWLCTEIQLVLRKSEAR